MDYYPHETLVTRSKRSMELERGLEHAEFIYRIFSGSGRDVETLAVLSLTARTGLTEQRQEHTLVPDWYQLRQHQLIYNNTMLDARNWLTDRGHVAISMVDSYKDGADIEASLHEPFLHCEVLPHLYAGLKNSPRSGDTYTFDA